MAKIQRRPNPPAPQHAAAVASVLMFPNQEAITRAMLAALQGTPRINRAAINALSEHYAGREFTPQTMGHFNRLFLVHSRGETSADMVKYRNALQRAVDIHK